MKNKLAQKKGAENIKVTGKRRAGLLLVAVVLAFTGCHKGAEYWPQYPQSYAPAVPTYVTTTETYPLELVPVTFHSREIKAYAVSRDGRLVLTGSYDDIVKLWDTSTGALLRTFEGHTDSIRAIAFSPDERTFLSAADNTVRLWEVATGRLLRTLQGHSGALGRVVFLPDGRHALSTGGQHGMFIATEVYLWDLAAATGKPIFTNNMRPIGSITVSPTSRFVVIASMQDDEKGRMYNNGNLPPDPPLKYDYTLLDLSVGAPLWVRTDLSSVVAFTSDGDYVIVLRGDRLLVVQALTGADVRDLGPQSAFNLPKSELPYEISESDVSTGHQRMTISSRSDVSYNRTIDQKLQPFFSMEFSPDGRRAAGGNADGSIKIVDLETGAVPQSLRAVLNGYTSVAFSSDSRRLFAGTIDNHVDYFDLGSGSLLFWSVAHPENEHGLKRPKIIWDHEEEKRAIHAVALSPSEATGLSGGWDGTARFWELGAGRRTRALVGHKDVILSLAFSPDGQQALTGGRDGTMRLWEARSGRLIQTFHMKERRDVTGVGFSRDGRQVYSGTRGPIVFRVGYTPDPDDKVEDTIQTWDKASGALERTITNVGYPYAFSPDGSLALAQGKHNVMVLYDLGTGAIRQALRGHRAPAHHAAISRDNRYAFTVSMDNTARLWRLDNGASVSIAVSDTDWLMFTDDGYFDASRHGSSLVYAVQGVRSFGIDQLAIRNNRPDIILERMGLSNSNTIADLRAQYEWRLHKFGLDQGTLSSMFDGIPEVKIVSLEQNDKIAEVIFNAQSPTAELQRYNVHVNGVPVFGMLGRPASGHVQRIAAQIELSDGENRIEVSVINTAGVESLRDFREISYGKKSRSELYFVGFGVSDYRDPRIGRLKYAAKDVSDLSSVIQGGYGPDQVHSFIFLNEDATVEKVRWVKNALSQARTDDTVILFVSGHGMRIAGVGGSYYFLTHATDPTRIAETAASFELFEDILDSARPRKKLFLIDTCESGERAIGELAAIQKVSDSKGLRPRLTRGVTTAHVAGLLPPLFFDRQRYIFNDLLRRTGAIVFSSSQGAEASFESDALENGLFTAELIAGLKTGVADTNKDGAASIDELEAYVSQAVASRSGGMQHPTIDRGNLAVNLLFPLPRP
jgi:WD40 repeat protein